MRLGDRDIAVKPLNFRMLEEFAPLMERVMSGGMKMADLKDVRSFITKALQRADASITDDFVLDNLDLPKAIEIMNEIVMASGGKKTGEAAPVADGQPKTGDTLTST